MHTDAHDCFAIVCAGMTLDRVIMDLTHAFDDGMAYVALSRGRAMEGIQLKGWDPSKVRAHPDVIQFYRQLPQQLAQAQGGVTDF